MSLALDLLLNPSGTFMCYLASLCLRFLGCKMGTISTCLGVVRNKRITYEESIRLSGLGGSQLSVILLAALPRHSDGEPAPSPILTTRFL